jgi:uncharacterized membrane protein YdfJ with MMPL/SSD domain
MILVPCMMALVGDPNWWLPTWLDGVLPRLDIEGDPDIVATTDERGSVSSSPS